MSTLPESERTLTTANGAAGAAESTVPSVATSPSPENGTTSSAGLATATSQSSPPPAVASYDATPPQPPATGEDGFFSSEDDEEEGMTMLEHLEELRVRIIICCVALAAGLALSAIPVPGYSSLTWNVIAVVNTPAAGKLIGIKPGEIFLTYFKVALIVGAALAMPVIIYQVMKFVLPALHPHEKKYLYMAVPGVSLSFLAGILFGHLLLVPFAINFLMTFGTSESGVEVMWSFSEYVGTVTSLLFWMGLAFEMPLLIFFLTKLGVLNVERLTGFRKYAFIGAFVIGAIITPTPDPLNQTIVSLPLYLLFEFGILLAKLA